MNPTYSDLLVHTITTGLIVDSRHGATVETLNAHVSFEAGELVTRKGMNMRLGWMEVLQLLACTFDLDAIKAAAPKAQHNLFTLQMAYGIRIMDQFRMAVDRLRLDPTTRQAVIFLGKRQDNMSDELTCTLSLQFILRQGHLDCIVSMRSWDLVKGLAYDVMMFGAVTQMLARALNVLPGAVHVNAGSAHVYMADVEKTLDAKNASQMFSFDDNIRWLSDFKSWAYGQIQNFKRSPDTWAHGVPSGIVLQTL